MSTEEANVNPDGSTTFDGEDPPVDNNNTTGGEGGGGGFEGAGGAEEALKDAAGGVDPAIYLLVSVLIIAALYYFFIFRKKDSNDEDGFFSNLDGDKFNLKLPSEVDEYYTIKEKCEAAGWKPGEGSGEAKQQGQPQNGPSRILAQALMKRAIADIPIVTHIQKESAGMNKLYSQSMCSVNQWRSYQAAEAMVSAEVEEVRAEADEVEPGWSGVIWRQAMQYHNMLKQKNEMEAKAAEEQAKKRKQIEQKVQQHKSKDEIAKEKELAAEKAAQELIKAEERDKQSKKAFKSGGSGAMKKGFLDGKKGSKKK